MCRNPEVGGGVLSEFDSRDPHPPIAIGRKPKIRTRIVENWLMSHISPVDFVLGFMEDSQRQVDPIVILENAPCDLSVFGERAPRPVRSSAFSPDLRVRFGAQNSTRPAVVSNSTSPFLADVPNQVSPNAAGPQVPMVRHWHALSSVI